MADFELEGLLARGDAPGPEATGALAARDTARGGAGEEGALVGGVVERIGRRHDVCAGGCGAGDGLPADGKVFGGDGDCGGCRCAAGFSSSSRHAKQRLVMGWRIKATWEECASPPPRV